MGSYLDLGAGDEPARENEQREHPASVPVQLRQDDPTHTLCPGRPQITNDSEMLTSG